MCCYYVVRFDNWKDYARGLTIATANKQPVECQPDMTIVISGDQLNQLRQAGINYGSGAGISR